MVEEIKVQFVKGNDTQQDEFIDFINYVFRLNGKDDDFYRLLPKLYKKEYHPCSFNYLVLENDRIKAAVGSFPGEMTVSGIRLKYEGIGNVAVNPYCRSKGYMKDLMNQAVNHMISEDIDLSMLGGRRQRYAYFSYENVGRKYSFWVDASNIKHAFGEERKVRFRFVPVDGNNKEILQSISELQRKQPTYYLREDDKIYDILKNKNSVDIYGIYEEMRFSGYLLCYNKNNIKEILLENQEDISDMIADFILHYAKDGMTIDIPDYQRYFINSISAFAEYTAVKDSGNFSVFRYDRVIEAFLRLKAQTDKLANGEIVLLIHGKKRDETLLVSVQDNKVSVSHTDQKTDFEYSHLEAMSVLFSNYSPLRSQLPMEIQTWLPLPIYIFPADEV